MKQLPTHHGIVESLIKIGKQSKSEFVSGFQLAFQKKKLTTKNNSKTKHTFQAPHKKSQTAPVSTRAWHSEKKQQNES